MDRRRCCVSIAFRMRHRTCSIICAKCARRANDKVPREDIATPHDDHRSCGTPVAEKKSNSPWMRSAPQSRFSLLICRMSSRSSRLILGRQPNRARGRRERVLITVRRFDECQQLVVSRRTYGTTLRQLAWPMSLAKKPGVGWIRFSPNATAGSGNEFTAGRTEFRGCG